MTDVIKLKTNDFYYQFLNSKQDVNSTQITQQVSEFIKDLNMDCGIIISPESNLNDYIWFTIKAYNDFLENYSTVIPAQKMIQDQPQNTLNMSSSNSNNTIVKSTPQFKVKDSGISKHKISNALGKLNMDRPDKLIAYIQTVSNIYADITATSNSEVVLLSNSSLYLILEI